MSRGRRRRALKPGRFNRLGLVSQKQHTDVHQEIVGVKSVQLFEQIYFVYLEQSGSEREKKGLFRSGIGCKWVGTCVRIRVTLDRLVCASSVSLF